MKGENFSINQRGKKYKLKSKNYKLSAGFSLVELLVIIAIISIMSSATVVGFGRMKEILQFRESISVIGDVVKQEELKVLRGDFEKVVIHFMENYLIIEQYPEEASLSLNIFDCLAQNPLVDYGVILGDQEGILIQSGPTGVIQTRNLKKNRFDCQMEFQNSSYSEVGYQLKYLNEVSPIIRFVHFNLRRDPVDNFIRIKAGAKSRVEIFAPYSKKNVYNHLQELKPEGSIIEIVDRSEEYKEKITLK